MITDRFDQYVMPEPNTGCHLWTGAAGGPGYGSYRKQRAHRYAYERANGPIPDGLWVLHRCDVPACVNPDHLFLGTCKDNVADMVRKGRDKNQQTFKTHCAKGHPYSGDNLFLRARGDKEHRGCRECNRVRNRGYDKKVGRNRNRRRLTKPKSRAAAMHYATPADGRAACGRNSAPDLRTKEPARVTCKECRRTTQFQQEGDRG